MNAEFENLMVYWISLNLAKNIHFMSQRFPEHLSYLRDSVRNNIFAVPVSIARSLPSSGKVYSKTFLDEAYTSCMACIPALEIIKETGIITLTEYHKLKSEMECIAGLLKGMA
ncbi:MAG: four helix bundle protein [Candidatus Omnitrophica bacterium]|nr:four helix bundle protein [Candidatus Omnitrophota bacterium]